MKNRALHCAAIGAVLRTSAARRHNGQQEEARDTSQTMPASEGGHKQEAVIVGAPGHWNKST